MTANRDARVKALYKMSKSALVIVWSNGAGRNVIYLATPVAKWSKDEIISDILRHEFGGSAS